MLVKYAIIHNPVRRVESTVSYGAEVTRYKTVKKFGRKKNKILPKIRYGQKQSF